MPRRLAAETDRERPATASALIYGELKHDITALRRRPGEPIAEKDIALAHGVSRTPVREALLRLASEGLVDVFPQSGTFVSRIPLSSLPEAIIIRAALEGTTARLAAERQDEAGIAAIEAQLERQRALAQTGELEAFHGADEGFHAAVAEAAGHPGIWALVQQVKVQVDRYRRLTLPQAGRMPLVVAQHARVLDAIRAGDGAAAEAAMKAHLDGLMDNLQATQHLNPDYFAPPAGTAR